MKKSILVFFSASILLSGCGSTQNHNQEAQIQNMRTTSIAAQVKVNGKQLAFDVPPVNDSGRILVPFRGIFEELQAQVQWEAATKTVIGSRCGTEVRLIIGSKTAYVNQRAITLDVPPKVVQGRTMVPTRFVSESLGANVGWDQPSKTVLIDIAPCRLQTKKDYDCGDFKTQAEAQAFFEAAGPGDPHRLDRDGNGIACESLP